jgi:hypothetical protein
MSMTDFDIVKSFFEQNTKYNVVQVGLNGDQFELQENGEFVHYVDEKVFYEMLNLIKSGGVPSLKDIISEV